MQATVHDEPHFMNTLPVAQNWGVGGGLAGDWKGKAENDLKLKYDYCYFMFYFAARSQWHLFLFCGLGVFFVLDAN